MFLGRPAPPVSATSARETLRYLDRNGIDAEPLLLKAELSRDQLSPESDGISVASQHRFLELAAIETNDPLLGLHVAAEMDLRDAGILFYLAAAFDDGRGSSRTPRAICGNGERSSPP
jgi:hypothetical protein